MILKDGGLAPRTDPDRSDADHHCRDPRTYKPDSGTRSGGRRGGGLAGWSARARWRTLGAAAVALIGAVLLLSGGITTTTADAQLVGDSATATRIQHQADFGELPTETVVVTARHGRLDTAAGAALGRRLARAYRAVEGVARVGPPRVAEDWSTLAIPVGLRAENDEQPVTNGRPTASEVVGPMLAETQRLDRLHPELEIGQVGPGSIDREVNARMAQDLRRAELFSLPVTLGILLLAFGSVVAAGLPLLLGMGAVLAALGLTAFASRHVTPVDQNTQSLVLLIGLAVGVDYALFLIRRSREERAAGASVRQAIARATATAGRAVAISGITVVVAMAGMLVAGGMFTSLAVGTMLVVLVAVLASSTVLPALLSVLGDRVESLRLPFSRRRAVQPGAADSTWGRLAGRVTRHPAIWAATVAALLMVIALPALGMRTSLSGVEALPHDLAVVDAHGRLIEAFPQEGTAVDVVVRAPASDADQVDRALRSAFPVAAATGQVTSTEPVVTASNDKSVHVLTLAVPYADSSPDLRRAVSAVRAEVVPQVEDSLADLPEAEVHVGGAAGVSDLTDWLSGRMPWVVAFVLVLTFIVMLFSFGSPWLAAASVGLNLLSVAASYGVVTLVFQHTWAEGLLGFTSIGAIAAWLPLLMFVVLFGLSMDYHVFVVSRVREAWTHGATPREAVRQGVGRSAGVVTSAAAVMVGVFSLFATLSSLEMKELGVGLATAVLLDATIVRAVLLPAVLAMLGTRAHTGPRWVPALHA